MYLCKSLIFVKLWFSVILKVWYSRYPEMLDSGPYQLVIGLNWGNNIPSLMLSRQFLSNMYKQHNVLVLHLLYFFLSRFISFFSSFFSIVSTYITLEKRELFIQWCCVNIRMFDWWNSRIYHKEFTVLSLKF